MRRVVPWAVWAVEMGIAFALFCSPSSSAANIEEVKNKHASQILGIPGVVGIGIGRCKDTPCIKVHLQHKTPAVEQAIPKELEGYLVFISEVTLDEIAAVQEKYTDQLMSLPGVVGIGIADCDGVLCLKVLLEHKTAESERAIPKELEGFTVVTEVTGRIEAR